MRRDRDAECWSPSSPHLLSCELGHLPSAYQLSFMLSRLSQFESRGTRMKDKCNQRFSCSMSTGNAGRAASSLPKKASSSA